MQTPERRLEMILEFVDGSNSTEDKLLYIYHAVRFEYALRRKLRAQRSLERHGTKVNNLVDIANFRVELNQY